MTNLISQAFKNNEKKLVTFVTGGDPDLETSIEIIKTIINNGADIIEIGMPFSDPMADGPTIQLSSNRAISKGIDLENIFSLASEAKKTRSDLPIILMGYYNLILYFGIEKFVKKCKENGVDGLIIVDLQPEEDEDLINELKKNEIDLIRLITPTTNEERLKLILKNETDITNGPRGINKIPRTWEHFTEERFYTNFPMNLFLNQKGWEAFFASIPKWWWQPFFAITIILIVIITYFFLEKLRVSPWGRMMTAIRENEKAAAAAGKNVTKRRIEAFILGAVIMGLAGAFLGQHLRLIEPTQTFDPSKMTFLVWVMLIAGGSGNNKGAILGAFLIWFVWSSSELVTNGVIEILATMFDSIDISILKNRAGFIRMLFIGLLLQLILQRFPKGILPEKRPAISGKSQKYAG